MSGTAVAPRATDRCARRALAALALTAIAAAGSAHELGNARADLRLEAQAWSFETTIDPEAVLARLDLAAGRTPASALPEHELHRHVAERLSELAGTFSVAIDGRPQNVTIEYRRLAAPGGAEGTVRFGGPLPAEAEALRLGWNLPYTAWAVTVHRVGTTTPETVWVEPGAVSPPIEVTPPAGSRMRVIRTYLELGFLHIVPRGLDHILFVLGIFLFATTLRPVLVQVTAFTLAHSITLALAIYGVAALPSSVVEPLIALSIVYVAVENALRPRLTHGRVALVFGFGLLHGLGFAGVLGELGLPRSDFLPALLAFNVGVEVGQLTVILVAFLAVAWWAREAPWYRARVVVPASLVIAAVGLYWTVERIGS